MKRTLVFMLALAMLTWLVSPAYIADVFAAEKDVPAEPKATIVKSMKALPGAIKRHVAWLVALLDNAGPMVGIGADLSVAGSKDVPPVVVYGVVKGRPAEKAGLQKGDVFLSVNGKAVAKPDDVVNEIRGDGKPGRLVTLEIDRNGTKLAVAVVTVVLRSDKTAEAEKMREAIERESAAHVAAIKTVADAIVKGLEDGSLSMKGFSDKNSTDPRILAYDKAYTDYVAWTDKKSAEIKKLLAVE